MGGVAKVHFIAMQVRPLHPQSPGDVTAGAGSDDLCDGQPDDGRNTQALGADTFIGPRRDRRESQAETQQHKDQR
ncbi:hypothetical protein D3C86_1617780 [compost metagenome]